jgi:hypothetical protein
MERNVVIKRRVTIVNGMVMFEGAGRWSRVGIRGRGNAT